MSSAAASAWESLTDAEAPGSAVEEMERLHSLSSDFDAGAVHAVYRDMNEEPIALVTVAGDYGLFVRRSLLEEPVWYRRSAVMPIVPAGESGGQ